MTTVNNSMDGSATQEPAPVPNPSEGKKNKAALIVAAIIAVVLVVSVTVGVVVWRRGESAKLEAAKEACSNALASVTKAKSVYEQAVANASEAKSVTAEQAADAKVVTVLSKELNATAPKTLSCTATDTDGLNATADKLNTQAKWYTTHEQSVKTASENVSKSRDEKTLNDARKALSDKEGAARKLLKDSEGKTPDDVARAQLAPGDQHGSRSGQGYGRREDERGRLRSGQGHEERERRSERETAGQRGRCGSSGSEEGSVLVLGLLVEPQLRQQQVQVLVYA